MRNSARFVVLMMALLCPSLVAAQTCLGNPSLGVTSGNVGVGASFFDGGKGFSLNGTVGRRLFATGSFTHYDYDDTDLSLKTLAGGVGLELAAQESDVRICPSAYIQYGTGLEIFGVDVTTVTFAPAVSFGVESQVSPTVAVVPSATVAVLFQRTKADGGPLGEETESQTDGALGLSLSFIFNDTFSVAPSVTIPVAAENGNTSFGIGASIGFRR